MRFLKGIKILLLVVLASFLFGWVIEHLWNWLMPGIFGLRTITYWQAIGLFLLSKLLFGGFHKHGHGGRGRRGWKRHWKQRWASMSPEEREKFRAGMRGQGHRWGEQAWSHEDRNRFREEVRARWCRPREDKVDKVTETKETV